MISRLLLVSVHESKDVLTYEIITDIAVVNIKTSFGDNYIPLQSQCY